MQRNHAKSGFGGDGNEKSPFALKLKEQWNERVVESKIIMSYYSQSTNQSVVVFMLLLHHYNLILSLHGIAWHQNKTRLFITYVQVYGWK